MRSRNVLALFLFCLPVVTGCSGSGQSAGALPLTADSQQQAASQGVAGTTPLPASVADSASVSQSAVSATATLSFPSDFPANAEAGAKARLTSAAWDRGGASSPVVKLDGPGSNGAKAFTYKRTDQTSAIVVYFPSGTALGKGWLSASFGANDSVPLMSTADDGAKWTDQTPGIGASATIYLTPIRVTLIDLSGSGAAATAAPSGSPTSAPSSTPKPAASSNPTAAPSGVSSCTHFVSNPICRQLPASPSVSAYSSAWSALEFATGHNHMSSFNAKAGANPFQDSADGSDPPFDELKAGGASIVQVIACDRVSWGPSVCTGNGIQGKRLAVPAGMAPAGNSDHHYSFDDDAARGEYDFWLVGSLPGAPGSTLHMGAGGFCGWSGDGTKCSGSNATNIAGSLGSISEGDFLRAEADSSHGSFGQAISFSALCADTTYVYPANASDGSNTNSTPACGGHTGAHQRPPEGTRLFLDLSDDQVNALNLPAYAKAFWRTLDREHQGGFIADTNWTGAQGLTPAFRRDDFSAQAREAGVNPVPYAQVPLGIGTIDLAHSIKFCTNGTC